MNIIFLESHDVSWWGLGMACKKFSHIKKFHMFWNPPWMHETIYKYGIVHQRNIVNEKKNRSIHNFFPPNCLKHQYLSWAIYFLRSLYKRISKNIRRLFHNYVCLSKFCLWHNFVYGCLRELWKLATCGLQKNVSIDFLYKFCISDFENPFQKTSERKNHQYSVIFSWIGLFPDIKSIIFIKMLCVTCSSLFHQHDKLYYIVIKHINFERPLI